MIHIIATELFLKAEIKAGEKLAHLRGAELGSLNENFYAKRVPL